MITLTLVSYNLVIVSLSLMIYMMSKTEGTGNAVGAVGNNALLKSYYGTSSHKDNYPDIFNITTNLGLTGSFVLNNDRKFVSTEFNPKI